MMRRYSRKNKRGFLKWITFAVVVMGTGLMIYSLYLTVRIESRFSGRRWSIPSKVLSDTTILYPGQSINRSFLIEKLDRLGYRRVYQDPIKKGEMRISKYGIDVFLEDLKIPSGSRKGLPVNILFSKQVIKSIKRLDNGKPLPILELEPEEMMLFFGPEREQRRLVSINQIPQYLIYAILSIEDHRFFQHHGLDPKGILRALYTNIRHRSIRQGGSTITQQLAKNYFLTPKRTISRKLKEALMSILIEMMYDKNEILEIYMNEIYLGNKGSVSINGFGEASHFYFGKPVNAISLSQAAVLAGLIRGPNIYSPYINKKRCRNRRNIVLSAMRRNGFISDEELIRALREPIKPSGYKDYGKRAPYFMDYLSEQLATLYSPKDLSSLGLSIYTTLDTQVQMSAERALEKGLIYLEDSIPALHRQDPNKKLQGAVIVIQPKTGYILAMVGGRNYGISQFNRITQARRQPGSSFKPFVYLAGLDKFTPASILSNKKKVYDIHGKIWEPRNFEEMPEENVTVRCALAKSINLATVDLAMQVGLKRIVSTAKDFQFTTRLRPYPSIALGAFEVIPLEMARAYCTFAADGNLPYPLSLKDVCDENGQILERRHMTIQNVTSPAKAYMMNSLLTSTVTIGTARKLKGLGIEFPVACKTGTTNEYKDAWFIGYTPDILALVWVGFDNGDSIFTTGSSAAMPIWADLMKSITHHISGNWFKMPPGIVKRVVCEESGQLAIYRCPNKIEEIFLLDNVPDVKCQIHRKGSPIKRLFKGVKDIVS